MFPTSSLTISTNFSISSTKKLHHHHHHHHHPTILFSNSILKSNKVSPTIPASSCCYLTVSSSKFKNTLSRFGGGIGSLQVCHNSLNSQNDVPPPKQPESTGTGRDWTTSILLSILFAALMYYVFFLTPNQTPTRDMYFLEKLLNLKGDDGFEMNKVLVSLWYIMGLWPLVYSMLLLPSGRSSESKIPVWPFLVLSFFGGAYALLPYFVLWKPPPPPVDEAELGRWPLNFLESKLTAGVFIFNP
ncbi:hypothetical protein AQUCO_06600034v1 [Aquilegia coerulea]|uniref:Cardiolipin synthase N-terminal domain-containing protein n=1 Tax=Aquilegia coerulea TaxID=218851 RepID=A0A2G5CC34_AQUCA|nr:hypothetical protein AQUCO_06600034v1 [Aquilegia coerulea]